MKTAYQCPTVEQLQELPTEALVSLRSTAELALAKPYFYDRIQTALFLKEDK